MGDAPLSPRRPAGQAERSEPLAGFVALPLSEGGRSIFIYGGIGSGGQAKHGAVALPESEPSCKDH